MEETKKVRNSRTSRMQYCLYLDALEDNEAFRENRFNAENPHQIKNMWEELCNKLNASGGAIKSTSEWKRTFSDWKAHVRKRARNLRASQLETGNVGQPEKKMTDLEERLLSITGKLAVEGLPVMELGIDQPSTSQENQHVEHIVTQLRAPTTTPRLQGVKRPRATLSNLVQNVTESVSNNEGVVDVLKSIDNTLKEILQIKRQKFELFKDATLPHM